MLCTPLPVQTSLSVRLFSRWLLVEMKSSTRLNVLTRCGLMLTLVMQNHSLPKCFTVVCLVQTQLSIFGSKQHAKHLAGEQLIHPAVTKQTHTTIYWTYKFNRQVHRDPLCHRSVLINKVEAAGGERESAPAAPPVTAGHVLVEGMWCWQLK